MDRRLLILGMFTLLALGRVFGPLKGLMNSAVGSYYYSHIVLIPLVSGYLFFRNRKAWPYELARDVIFGPNRQPPDLFLSEDL